MILGVDLDNVTCGYTEGLREHMMKVTGLPAESFPNPEDYGYSDWPEINEDFVKNHAEAVTQGLYLNLQLKEKAHETLWKLNDEGHHIRIVTSRFVKHGQNYRVVANTAKWLDENDIPYRDLLFLKDKASARVDLYIDDAPSNIESFIKVDQPYVIFDTEYNRHLPGPRVSNWVELYDHIQSLENQELAAPPL